MFRTNLKISAFVLTVFLIVAPRTKGQTATAVIVGTVRDPSQAVVPNVKVTAFRTATGQNFTTVSSGTGDYVFSNLPVGEYTLQAEKDGVKTEVKNGVLLEIGRTIRVDFSLGVGEVTQKAEVTAQAPLLDTENATVGQVIGNREIESLPLNGRDWLDLTTLAPGVLPTAGHIQGGGIHSMNFLVRGLRNSDNVIYLNGALVIQGNGGTTFYPSPDALQEFQFKSGLYDAQFGIMPGGSDCGCYQERNESVSRRRL